MRLYLSTQTLASGLVPDSARRTKVAPARFGPEYFIPNPAPLWLLHDIVVYTFCAAVQD